MQDQRKPVGDAIRKRVAVEMIARHERALRRTARRYSICAEDAEDAYQRALEILLTKAPPGEARELVRWMQTVTKHEALAVRRSRERQMGPTPRGFEDEPEDWVARIPSGGAGPAERAERRESIARSREALQALKPAELRALTLLAEGYSYEEIGRITGWTRTKINRCLAEGRESYRAIVSRSESGGRCAELRPALSAFCDGEATPQETATLREHLRACAHCRAALRSYRAAPGAAAALAPLPLLAPTLTQRFQEAVAGLQARLAERVGGSAEAATQVAASGGGGVGVAVKAIAICAGAAGGAAACVGAGVVPSPLPASQERAVAPKVRQVSEAPASTAIEAPASPPAASDPAPEPPPPPEPAAQAPTPVEAGAVTYTPSPTAEPTSSSAPPVESSPPASATSGDPAGEFGP